MDRAVAVHEVARGGVLLGVRYRHVHAPPQRPRSAEGLDEDRDERLAGGRSLGEGHQGGRVQGAGVQVEAVQQAGLVPLQFDVGQQARTAVDTPVQRAPAAHRGPVLDALLTGAGVQLRHVAAGGRGPLQRVRVEHGFGLVGGGEPRREVPRPAGDGRAVAQGTALTDDLACATGLRSDGQPYLPVDPLGRRHHLGEQHVAQDRCRPVHALCREHPEDDVEEGDSGQHRDSVHPVVAHDEVGVAQEQPAPDRAVGHGGVLFRFLSALRSRSRRGGPPRRAGPHGPSCRCG